MTLILTFNLLTSGSVHAKVLPWAIGLPSCLSVSSAIFLLEHGQTDTQTYRQMQLNALSPAGGYTASVGLRADEMAQKINSLISESRKRRLSHLSEVSPKELWQLFQLIKAGFAKIALMCITLIQMSLVTILPTALEMEIMQLPPSVHPSVFLFVYSLFLKKLTFDLELLRVIRT